MRLLLRLFGATVLELEVGDTEDRPAPEGTGCADLSIGFGGST